MNERLGIFGGTFDPPHIGHQILAAEALDQLGLSKVLWVLTPNPPHKQERKISNLGVRMEMVEAAIKDSSNFELSRVDIDRPAPHYAIGTVRLLQDQNPQSELIYLMGGDSLDDLACWHACNEFVAACHAIGVMHRPGETFDLEWLESQIPGIRQKIEIVETPLLGIAASQIRHRIFTGRSFQHFLPQSVYQIIQKRSLYQKPKL